MRVTKWNLEGLINTFNKVIRVSKRYQKPLNFSARGTEALTSAFSTSAFPTLIGKTHPTV